MSERDRELGERYVQALVAKDAEALRALLDPNIDFRGMTPGDFWEAHTPEKVVDEILLGEWFESGDDITSLISIDTGAVMDRSRVTYRVTVTNAQGDWIVEQQCYYDVVDDRISLMRLMCSGMLAAAPGP